MKPLLLKPTAGRRQKERKKRCTEGGSSTTKKKGSHQCPIYKGYGHRWYNCKYGDPDDIAAMLAEKGEPKRRKKTIEPSCESSIVPVKAGPKTMQFPSRYASMHLQISHVIFIFVILKNVSFFYITAKVLQLT